MPAFYWKRPSCRLSTGNGRLADFLLETTVLPTFYWQRPSCRLSTGNGRLAGFLLETAVFMTLYWKRPASSLSTGSDCLHDFLLEAAGFMTCDRPSSWKWSLWPAFLLGATALTHRRLESNPANYNQQEDWRDNAAYKS